MSYFDDVIEPRIINGTYYVKGPRMAYQQKDGDIAIYKVADKKTEQHPDWTGRALIDGKEKDISLWFKSETMLTGKIKEKFKPPFKKLADDISKTADMHNRPIEDDTIPF